MLNVSKLWLGDVTERDSYRDFLCDFTLQAVGKLKLKAAADSKFVCYLNGRLCGFGECADFPETREYFEFDISDSAKPGENRLEITVWHLGDGESSTYSAGDAFLAFSVEHKPRRPRSFHLAIRPFKCYSRGGKGVGHNRVSPFKQRYLAHR